MTIGERIKELRKQKNLRQKELAAKIDVGKSTVCSWEQEISEPNPTQRRKLCEVLGITEAELFGAPSPTKIEIDKRAIPVFNASCGKILNWSDGSYPVGYYPDTEPTDSKDPHAFYVRANGDSMTGRADDRRTIFDGDLLLVEPNKQIENGDIVLCRFDDGVIVKKLKKEDDRIRLIPLNDKYTITDLTPKDKFHVFPITEIKRKLRR